MYCITEQSILFTCLFFLGMNMCVGRIFIHLWCVQLSNGSMFSVTDCANVSKYMCVCREGSIYQLSHFTCSASLFPETLCVSMVSCHGNKWGHMSLCSHAGVCLCVCVCMLVNVLSCVGLFAVVWKGSSFSLCLCSFSMTSRRCFACGSFLGLEAETLSCGGLGPSGAAPLWEKTLRQCLPNCVCCLPDSGSRGAVERLQRRFCSWCRTAVEQTASQSPLCPTWAHGWWELEVCIEERGKTWTPHYCWYLANSPLLESQWAWKLDVVPPSLWHQGTWDDLLPSRKGYSPHPTCQWVWSILWSPVARQGADTIELPPHSSRS